MNEFFVRPVLYTMVNVTIW